ITDLSREPEALISDVESVQFTPNPVNTGTTFTSLTYTLKNDVNYVSVKIYSTEGALIKNIEGLPNKKSATAYDQAKWDLTDWRGVSVANGQYSFKFIYKKGETEYVKSGKISIQK
ncbi:MAG TPA: FlgD immunoglobulin-like domain containing protein, partial [Candidatus Wallbacteria bacterium]|nr:FlgD immunoglobulin-like domain containing protein [Candidatus Wallbacteria bacterium]